MHRLSRRIAATLLTLTLTLGALKAASLVLYYRQPDTAFIPHSFYNDKKREYDVLFIGTSHVYDSMQPMNLWRNYGITSYNLGSPGARIATSYHILKNALYKHKPKFVLLDTFLADSNDKVSSYKSQLHMSFDSIPLTLRKYESLVDLFPDFNKRMEFVFPYSIYHNRWKELSVENVWDILFHIMKEEGKISVYTKGQEIMVTSITTEPATSSQTDLSLPYDTLGMNYIRMAVSLCKENGIIPILITVPYSADEQKQMGENSIAILSKELTVPYYNLNKLNITDRYIDFDHVEHLNISGGRKVTDWIGKMLAENYHLEDHRSDPNYASWHDDYDAYRHKIYSIISIKEDFKSSLMLCNNSIFTSRLSIKNGVELDNIEQKLVAQLGESIHVEHTALEDGIPALQLEVYDSETGCLICEKRW